MGIEPTLLAESRSLALLGVSRTPVLTPLRVGPFYGR